MILVKYPYIVMPAGMTSVKMAPEVLSCMSAHWVDELRTESCTKVTARYSPMEVVKEEPDPPIYSAPAKPNDCFSKYVVMVLKIKLNLVKVDNLQ